MKTYQLPKEFATKWVEALRSGEYQQTTIGLCYNNQYCCLGVACMVAGTKSNQIESQGTTISDYHGWRTKMKITTKRFFRKIPKQLKGSASTNKLVGILVGINDDKGYSFPQIADWIEQNVEFI